MPEGPQVAKSANLINSFQAATILQIHHPISRKPWDLNLPLELKSAQSVGKNIFIELSNGSLIYNHMLMWGSWRASTETTGKKRLNTAFITSKGNLGYFGGGVLKLITPTEAEEIKSHIGPEILRSRSASESFRSLANDKRAIGEAILDQQVVAGVGNIYKSEGLFVARIHPLTQASLISEQLYDKLFNFLFSQMTKDINRPGPINTTGQKTLRNFVYRRNGQKCLFCSTKILRIYQGATLKRSTYFCPRCQTP